MRLRYQWVTFGQAYRECGCNSCARPAALSQRVRRIGAHRKQASVGADNTGLVVLPQWDMATCVRLLPRYTHRNDIDGYRRREGAWACRA